MILAIVVGPLLIICLKYVKNAIWSVLPFNNIFDAKVLFCRISLFRHHKKAYYTYTAFYSDEKVC